MKCRGVHLSHRPDFYGLGMETFVISGFGRHREVLVNENRFEDGDECDTVVSVVTWGY